VIVAESSASLFLGRFQPFHSGHIGIVRKLLAEGRRVVIGIRSGAFDSKNPFSLSQRITQIRSTFPDRETVDIVVIPDFDEVVMGRTPGWKIREVLLEQDADTPSGTALRRGRVIWFTGRSRTGKTTLAQALKTTFLPSAIVLDADEIRHSISIDLGYSDAERMEHNRRMAEMARIISEHGHIVIVTSIAPTAAIRDMVSKIVNPIWVYLSGGNELDCHYDAPNWPDVQLDLGGIVLTTSEATEQIFNKLRVMLL